VNCATGHSQKTLAIMTMMQPVDPSHKTTCMENLNGTHLLNTNQTTGFLIISVCVITTATKREENAIFHGPKVKGRIITPKQMRVAKDRIIIDL